MRVFRSKSVYRQFIIYYERIISYLYRIFVQIYQLKTISFRSRLKSADNETKKMSASFDKSDASEVEFFTSDCKLKCGLDFAALLCELLDKLIREQRIEPLYQVVKRLIREAYRPNALFKQRVSRWGVFLIKEKSFRQ